VIQREAKSASRPPLRREPRGQGQIELVLSMLTIAFVIFWTCEVVMAVYTYSVLADAAKEGVRYAIVHGSRNSNCSGPNVPPCPDIAGNNVVNLVKDYARYSLHDVSTMTVSVTYPDGSITSPSRVRVEVAYRFVPFTALPLRPTLRAAAEGRIAN
jgi:hypothetical protein